MRNSIANIQRSPRSTRNSVKFSKLMNNFMQMEVRPPPPKKKSEREREREREEEEEEEEEEERGN